MELQLKEQTVLGEACKLLGWQGGTIHQVKEELLNKPFQPRNDLLNTLLDKVWHDAKLVEVFNAEYAPLRTKPNCWHFMEEGYIRESWLTEEEVNERVERHSRFFPDIEFCSVYIEQL